MKLILVSPPFGENGQKSKGLPIAPPVLEYLAGLTLHTRPEIQIELIDANIDDFNSETVQADLVGFTVLTPQAPWAYRTGDKLKKRGIPVIMGGIHVTALPEEAAPYTDSMVLGEAESVWETVLADIEKGQLKSLYRGERLPLENLPRPQTDILPHKYRFGSFFTSRGCPHRCSFCSVHKFFGGKVRLRSIPEVVSEVAASKRKFFWNIDDNIWGVNVPRSIELFRELTQNIKGKYWFGAGDLVSLDHPRADEMLDWARRAGLTSAMVGWESNNTLTLDEFNAHAKQGRSRADAIKKIRAAGIDVMLFIMVGSRKDTREDFEGIIKLCDELDVSAHPVMTIPLPQTDLYKEYEPYIIPGYDWDKFDGNRAVFYHPTMSPEEREEALARLWTETFRLPKIFRRMCKISLKGFPAAHITSFMVQYSQRRAFGQYARKEFAKAGGKHD